MTSIVYSYNGVVTWEWEGEESVPARTRAVESVDEKGRAAWAWLHEQSQNDSLTMERLAGEFLPMIPRYKCGCLDEWNALLEKIPFRLDDQFAWSVEIHNAINVKLKKPELALDQARTLWPPSSLVLSN